ncbi:TraI domain-containing protein [Vibrio penaeicida]|uniref:TraI domain-containing protein n=1 Tax=Vibrio penaeicida TaxID=104609 RepID=UPI001CC4B315|nr:TraI domain-containing protein [Vibrio penaeicida]
MGLTLIRLNRKIDEVIKTLKGFFIQEKVIIRDALYPTFYATYPFDKNTVELIEDNYRSHILNTRQKMDFSDEQFNQIIRPILHHVIKYFMALPASERHHHTDMSASLFFHSLQTANIALAKYNSTTVIPDHIKIEHKNEYKHAASVAVFLAALFHDAGKLYSDMSVYPSDEKGQLVSTEPWDPISQSLYDYCLNNGVTHYRVKFDVNRKHNAHNAFTTRFVSTMPDFPDDYSCSSQILVILDGILFGTKEPHTATLNRLVKEADSQSLTMDFQRYSRPIQSDNLSVLTLDSIKSYIEYYPDLAPTDPRSILIRTNLGVHIPYPSGMEELINFARGNHSKISTKIKDLIPNADKMLKVLNESGYLQHHYFQTVARSPQVVRTIKFEFNGRYHNLKVITLRPSEVIALIPTRHVLQATYDDEISSEFIKVAKQSIVDSQSPQEVSNQNQPHNDGHQTEAYSSQHDHRPVEPEPLPLIKNTISSKSLEDTLKGAEEINIVLKTDKPTAEQEQTNPVSKPPKKQGQSEKQNAPVKSNSIPADYESFMVHIMPLHIESLQPDWKTSDVVKELHHSLSDIEVYRNSQTKLQELIQEFCIAFSKGLIIFNEDTEHIVFFEEQLYLSSDLMNYLCRNTPSGSTYNIHKIQLDIAKETMFRWTVMPGTNSKAWSISSEISKVILGEIYFNITGKE